MHEMIELLWIFILSNNSDSKTGLKKYTRWILNKYICTYMHCKKTYKKKV